MGKRVVVDASLAIDLFVGRDEVRIGIAEELFDSIQRGLIDAYAPRLFPAETGGVIARYVPRRAAEEAVKRLTKIVTVVSDDVFYKTSIQIALLTGSRGADAYYIGKVLYPNRFSDIDPAAKADEIFKVFLGKALYEEFIKGYGVGFSNVANMFRCG